MARRNYQATVGPEARAGWKEEWSWKDKKGVWRKRTVYGSGVAKLDADVGVSSVDGDGRRDNGEPQEAHEFRRDYREHHGRYAPRRRRG